MARRNTGYATLQFVVNELIATIAVADITSPSWNVDDLVTISWGPITAKKDYDVKVLYL